MNVIPFVFNHSIRENSRVIRGPHYYKELGNKDYFLLLNFANI